MKTESLDFKYEYRATLADARRVHARLRSLVRPLGYAVSIHGSTLTRGRGHDIDVHVVGLGEDQRATPNRLALMIVKKMASKLYLYEQVDVGDGSDVYLNIVTRGGLYLDVHIKGFAQLALGEAEVVPGEQLSAVMRRWIVEWLAERPASEMSQAYAAAWQGGSVDYRVLGPIEVLHERTGIHTRRISGICNGEFRYVSLSQADALLQAAQLPHVLGIEVSVIPNPNWSQESWDEYMNSRCCHSEED